MWGSNTTVRGPGAPSAARSDPGPPSASVVTVTTRPPRPARVVIPVPSAPGMTGRGSGEPPALPTS